MTENFPGPMAGKTALVTGGTGGIGRATAAGLAALGARVGITGRDKARTQAAATGIIRESGNPAVDAFAADMSCQAEVRALAAAVRGAYPRLDVLVNNVGGFWATRHLTADGLERTFAVNHLAAFLLTGLVLDRLKGSAPARIVTVSSNAQAAGRLDFDDLQGERSYSGQRAYSQSKLANVVFTYELARRLEGTGVTATALHPRPGAHVVLRRGPIPPLEGHDSVAAAVHEGTRPRRGHFHLSGIRTRGRGRHRPVFRQPQAENLKQGFLRHRRRRAALADQRRPDRPQHPRPGDPTPRDLTRATAVAQRSRLADRPGKAYRRRHDSASERKTGSLSLSANTSPLRGEGMRVQNTP